MDIDLANPSQSTLQPLATRTGILETKTYMAQKKEKVMLEIVPLYSNRYSPSADEVVIGVVVAKNFENFTIDINCEYGHANLNTMEFQGATKTNKPKYEEGTLVICRVLKVEKFASKIVELTCIDPLQKKSWNSGEATYRDLKGGMVKDFPIDFCRDVMSKQSTPVQSLLEKLGTKFNYEVVVGYNGKIWVRGERPADVIFIFNALERLVEMGSHQLSSVDFIVSTLPDSGKK
jgi:exosome complex component RRP40